ncbi:MAG: helix-hairpin-helix domain-containing protein [Deltaproteobacteria bacterium]|nr:helix-hairpin-helix domain-containing protein [Deltaproteobacteria bacterium]
MVLIWMIVWLWPSDKTARDILSAPLLGPLTPHEKILLGYKLDINRLSQKDLEVLPGIGPATAGKIAAFRRDHGPFRNLEEMDKVRGIGPKTIQTLKPYLSKF